MPKEMPFKQWLTEEAIREGITPGGVWDRWARGYYRRKITRRRVNRRVIFVRVLKKG
jgi:hypothetical protein